MMSGTPREIVIFFTLGCLVWIHTLERMTDDGGRVMGPFWAVETSRDTRSSQCVPAEQGIVGVLRSRPKL